MSEVTADGFVRTRLDERVLELQEAMRDIFGPDIAIDADDMDGQTIGVFAEYISNSDQLAEDVYNSLNPSSATGSALTRLVPLNGIRRLGGAPSTVTLTLHGTATTVVHAGVRVKHTGSLTVFTTDSEVVIGGGGTVDVAATAEEEGALPAAAGSDWTVLTPVFGLTSVTSFLDAVLGRLTESDAELRARRRASVATPSQSLLDGLYGSLANLDDVTQVRVYENYTGTTDSDGLPPHSVYCIVEGGDEDEIANTIWLKKSMGATLFGAEEVTITDSQEHEHLIKFARPSYVPIYVVIDVTALVGWPTDGDDQMKAAMVADRLANQRIGGDVIQSRLYDALNTIPGHSITALKIGIAPAPADEDDIDIDFDALATFSEVNITVNVT